MNIQQRKVQLYKWQYSLLISEPVVIQGYEIWGLECKCEI